MPRRLVFRAQARAELSALYEYVRDQSGSPELGRDYVRRILLKCDLLAEFPLIGRRRGELSAGLRGIAFDRRVTILQSVKPRTVEIVRILHRGREIDAALR